MEYFGINKPVNDIVSLCIQAYQRVTSNLGQLFYAINKG